MEDINYQNIKINININLLIFMGNRVGWIVYNFYTLETFNANSLLPSTIVKHIPL